jgi:hypothetical protein
MIASIFFRWYCNAAATMMKGIKGKGGGMSAAVAMAVPEDPEHCVASHCPMRQAENVLRR